MAVVKNLMIRIGADYSSAKKTMDGATRDLSKFKREATRATDEIAGRKGLGGIGGEIKGLGSTVSSSLSRIRGAKGIGGVVSELGSLRPALGSAISGFRGMGVAATGAGVAVGSAVLVVTAFVAVLGVAVAGIAKASQEAVKFEADLGRVNKQLKGGTRDFMQWARSMGLAKSTAAEMGATYSVLLSSFIRDNKALNASTKEIVQATRVVASNTGRSVEDVLERMRSGLLGNTEAIEDLGIFVNVSMIESTKAFRKFANGKSWDQLDFRVQQQIRLAAILEQAYDRYGDKLQNNVMTKQSALTEQLKDVKLNLSQAFLPIWDAILPSLTKFATALADTTERIARFVYWLRGWDYDERTQGTKDQTDAVKDEGKAYDDLGKSAKKARGELAAFDQLNLLGDPSGGSGGSGGSGSGGTGGGGGSSGGSGGSGSEWKPPVIPPEFAKKWRIEFDTPSPPDAGAGAVATAVTRTMNGLIAETKLKFAQMWSDLRAQTQVGASGQQAEWQSMWGNLGAQTQAGAVGQSAAWSNMWRDLQGQTAVNSPALQAQMANMFRGIQTNATTSENLVRVGWKATLTGMLTDVLAYQPPISASWQKIITTVASTSPALATVKADWHGALDFMQSKLNAYRPYLEYGWQLLRTEISKLNTPLSEVKSAWSTALQDMNTIAHSYLGGIESAINSVVSAWSRMKQALTNKPVSTPATSPAAAGSPAPSKAPATSTGRAPWADNTPVLSDIYKGLDWLSNATSWTKSLEPYAVPGPGSAGALGGLAQGASKLFDDALAGLSKLLQGSGIAVPAFASGAVVYGPTLAMVGDNRGAATDPEVIAPLSELETIMGSNDGEMVTVLRAILQAVQENKTIQAVISATDVTNTAIKGINDKTRQMGRSPIKV